MVSNGFHCGLGSIGKMRIYILLLVQSKNTSGVYLYIATIVRWLTLLDCKCAWIKR